MRQYVELPSMVPRTGQPLINIGYCHQWSVKGCFCLIPCIIPRAWYSAWGKWPNDKYC